MAYLRHILVFLAVLVIVLIFRRLPYTSTLFLKAEGSLSAAGASIGRGVTRLFSSEESYAVRYKTCEEDKALLAREAVEFARLQTENRELRELLEYKEMSNREGVAARIIARSLPGSESKVIIDKGSEHGVREGSTVIVGQGIVFGIVHEVNALTSVVTLITSSESKIPAAILHEKKTIGLLEGRDGFMVSMQFIPREAGVSRGDVVVSSGLEGQIPEGLLLGTVTEVIDMESAPFSEALVEPLQDPLLWSLVLVLP